MNGCKLPQVPWLYRTPWTPPEIFARADMLYADAFEIRAPRWKLDVVYRLATDPRMRAVWRELRPDPEFFRQIVLLAWSWPLTVRRSEIEDKAKHFSDMAKMLAEDACELGVDGLVFGASAVLLQAAQLYESLANAFSEVDDPKIATRGRADPLLRGFAVGAAQIMQVFFQKDNCGTIGTLYGVAYNAPAVPYERIRALLRDLKRQKKTAKTRAKAQKKCD